MKHGKLIIVAAVIIAAMSMSVARAQAPRSAPSNDDVSGALSIALNSNYKVKNANLASLEGGENACGGSSPYSVWFTFVAPISANIAISTTGSKLVSSPTDTNANTIVTIHWPTESEADEIACGGFSGGAGGYISNVSISAGQTYYVRVASLNPFLLPGSVYKLQTRIILANYAVGPLNGGFELAPIQWTVKKALNGDGVVCGTGEDFAGNCAFKFFGGPNEATSVQQTRPWPTTLFTGVVGQPVLGGMRLNRTGSGIDFKVIFKLTYSDGTPATKVKASVTTASATYELVRVMAFMESADISAVKLKLKNKSTGGTVLVDTVYMTYAGGFVRGPGGGPLPVPPVAQ